MEWEVFQRDVLDVLRQYEGYFDFFERVGSLSDDSRPDCFARISREEKKEIWVVDAKNKGEIDEDDRQRMNKYIEMLESNPIDSGLEVSEISDYTFRGIFVTSREVRSEKFESIPFNSLHQFLQKELIYTDTDRVVRDISKMMERQELSQSQARVLFRSLKPYEKRFERGIEILENIGQDYTGLNVKEPPFESFDRKLPVDIILTHDKRDIAFLFDIPYSWREIKQVDEKAEEIEQLLEDLDKEVYYAAINTFEKTDLEYTVQPEQVEKQIRQKAGIISPETIVEMFEPKIRTEKEFFDGKIILDSEETDFRMAVKSEDDIKHKIQVLLPEKAAKKLKNNMLNAQTEFGEISGNNFYLEIEIDREFNINTPDKLDFSNFKDKVNSIYNPSINPVLSRQVSKTTKN